MSSEHVSLIEQVLRTAEEYNVKHSVKRYYPMTSYNKNGKMVEYGLYDYHKKKYALFSTYSLTIDQDIKDLQSFVDKVKNGKAR